MCGTYNDGVWYVWWYRVRAVRGDAARRRVAGGARARVLGAQEARRARVLDVPRAPPWLPGARGHPPRPPRSAPPHSQPSAPSAALPPTRPHRKPH